MSYKHFTKDERNELSILLKKGFSHKDIAGVLGKNPPSISREVSRNSVNGQYDPSKAQHKAHVKRKYSKYQGMKIIENRWLERYIEEKIKLSWSPEEIAGRLKLENRGKTVIVAKSIYKYLYTVYGQALCKYLKYKRWKPRRKKQTKSVQEIIKNWVFVDQRPAIINQRERFGDFEGDTLGIPKGAKESLVALIERKSRYILAKKISQLKEAMEGFKQLFSLVPALSLTLDNGPENTRYQELGIPTYFCHPHHSWEKGSIENALGQVREYIPKKKDLANYSEGEIDVIVETINNTPRKCLGFKTPKEILEEQFLGKFKHLNVALRGTIQAFYSQLILL